MARLSTLERLMQYVYKDPSTGCWLWTGCCYPNGYGAFRVKGRTRPAHCYSYELHIGLVPEGRELDHTCHKPEQCAGSYTCIHRKCVNPAHLEPVTHVENLRRGGRPGSFHRNKTQCVAGHPYDDANTYVAPASGYRYCRECSRLAQQRHRAKNEAA